MNYIINASVFTFNFLVGKCGMGCVKEWVTNRTFSSFQNYKFIIWPDLLLKGLHEDAWHKVEIQNN